MSISTGHLGEELIQLLSQQQLLYRQLHELAGQQSHLVDGSNPEMLLRVLAARQRLIDRLSQINRQLEPIRSDWERIAESLPAGQREQVQGLISNVQQILAEILERDEKDSEALSRQKEQVAGQIRGTAQGKKMNQAYAQAAGVGSRFVDTHSE